MSKDTSSEYRFRLFSYFSMAIISIAVLVGLVFFFQHIESDAKQDAVIQNQQLIKQLINDSRAHEDREEKILGNNTAHNTLISSNNTKKLDKILDYLNITYP